MIVPGGSDIELGVGAGIIGRVGIGPTAKTFVSGAGATVVAGLLVSFAATACGTATGCVGGTA